MTDTPNTPPVPAAEGDAVEVEREDRRSWMRAALELGEKVKQERARAEAAEAEVERLRERMPCDGGCNPNSGPEEECSLHGRPPREVWDALGMVQQREADLRGLLGRVLTEVTAPGNAGLRTAIRAALAGDTTEAGAEPYPGFRQEREDRHVDTDGVPWCLTHTKPLDAEPCPDCTKQVRIAALGHADISGDGSACSCGWDRPLAPGAPSRGAWASHFARAVTDTTDGGAS